MDVEAIRAAFPRGQPGKENRRMGVFPLFRFFPSNTEFVGFLPEVLTVRCGRNFKRFFAGFLRAYPPTLDEAFDRRDGTVLGNTGKLRGAVTNW